MGGPREEPPLSEFSSEKNENSVLHSSLRARWPGDRLAFPVFRIPVLNPKP